ncbi:MAG: DUF4097 family beta strand repeat protein [Bdellovibrionales bacterium]|nr:DUF4097 family beta strand repeat protein [Bdellovibrionales bacterium]
MRHLLLSLTVFWTLLVAVPCLAIQSFTLQVEQDLALKHALPVYIQHRLGDLSVQGWVQDRIRVEMKMKVLAETKEAAEQEFKKLDLITFEGKDRFEIRMGHSQGVDLVSKMRDRAKNPVQVDLFIKAPYQSNLSIVMGEGKRMKLEQWRGSVSLTGKGDFLSFGNLDLSGEISLNCIQCETEIRDSTLSGRISVGSKPVTLSGVNSKILNIDGGTEEIRIDQSTGKFTVHTRSGRLTVSRFKGDVQFQSEEGGAYLSQYSGGADIHTGSGQVVIDMDEVRNGLNVDTEKSDIQIGLLPSFVGGLDLKSLRGDVIVQFPYEISGNSNLNRYGPASSGQVDGAIGRKTRPLIHAYSKQGGVRIIRKVPTR